MSHILVTDREGREHRLDAPEGWRVMEIIREHGLAIRGECGGACACATCHVYVDPSWEGRLPPLGEEEEAMLDEAYKVGARSRLSCQLLFAEDLAGLRVELAPEDR